MEEWTTGIPNSNWGGSTSDFSSSWQPDTPSITSVWLEAIEKVKKEWEKRIGNLEKLRISVLAEELSDVKTPIVDFFLRIVKKISDRDEVLKWEINKEKISEELSKFFSSLELKVKEIKIFDNPKEFGNYFIEKVVDEELREKIKKDKIYIDDILKVVKKYREQDLISEFERKRELIDNFIYKTIGEKSIFGSDIGVGEESKTSAEYFEILKNVYQLVEENFLGFSILWERFREKENKSISSLFREDEGETLRSIYIEFLRSWFRGGFLKLMQLLRRYLVCYKVWKKTQSENYERLTKLLEPAYNALTNGAFLLNFIENEAIVLTAPDVYLRDKRLHNEKGPAISWNGIGFYCLEGIRLEKDIWEKIVNRTLTGKEFLKIENLEIKSLAVRYVGYLNLLKDLEYKVLDREKVVIGTEFYDEEVIEVNLKDDDVPARFVKVRDFSTKREFLIRVDPRNKQTKTVKGALAWVAGVETEEYKPQIET